MSKSTFIHPTAIVDPKATLGIGVHIGPYSIVGPDVELGDQVELKSHVVIETRAKVGEKTVIYPFASLNETQDKKYNGEASILEIGANTIIREYVTLQPGTAGDRMRTVVGDNCLLMACTHVAHDCIVGNHVVMANHATLAGHVVVEDYAIIGGLAAVHQFVRIGAYAIIGGMSGVDQDVIPFGNVKGERAFLNGLNLVGLKRRGFEREAVDTLRAAYEEIFDQQGVFQERVATVQQKFATQPLVQQMINFIVATERSVLGPKKVK